MASVLTVEAKLKGDAASLVGASRKGADALDKVAAAAKRAKQAGDGFEGIGQKIAYTFGGMLRLAAQAGVGIASFGAKVAAAMVKIATRATIAGAALSAVFVGGAVKQGLDRLMSIQDATVALTRMLGGASQAAALTNEVLKVVQGTPFAFPQFAEATRQLVAFGVKAEKVPGILTAIADSAAASGEGAEAVGRITQAFANMAVTGKLNSDIIQSLGSAGVNALGLLANHFGVTTAEAQEMVSEGMIPAEEAMDILVNGIENGSKGIAGDFKALKGAAQDLGKTISGSLGNVKAAFARMGATWLKPFEKDFPRVLNDGVIPLLDKLGAAGGAVMAEFADTGALDKVVSLFQRMQDYVWPLAQGLVNVFSALSPLGAVWEALKQVLPQVQAPLENIGRIMAGEVVPALAGLFSAMTPLIPIMAELAEVFARGLAAAIPILTPMIEGLVAVLGFLVDTLAGLPDWVLGVATALMILNSAGVPVVEILKRVGEFAMEVFDVFRNGGGATTTVAEGLGDVAAGADNAKGKMGGLSGFLASNWALGVAAAATAVIGLITWLNSLQAKSEEIRAAFSTGNVNEVMGAATKGLDTKWFTDVKAQISDLDGHLEQSAERWNNFFYGIGEGSFKITAGNDALGKLGKELAKLAEEDLPAAQEGFNVLGQKTNGSHESMWRLLSVQSEYRDMLVSMAEQMGYNVSNLENFTTQQLLLNMATGEGITPTSQLGEQLALLAGKAYDATGKFAEASNSINTFGSGTLKTNASARQFEASVDALNESLAQQKAEYEAAHGTLDGFTASLDISTSAGRANEAALDAIAEAALKSSADIMEMTGSHEDAKVAIMNGRDELIKLLAEFGITGQAAEDYANKLGLIPDNVTTVLNLSGFDEAYNSIMSVQNALRSLDGASAGLHIATGQGGQGGLTFEDGGLVAGGKVKAYANGNISTGVARVPQMVKGGANILWGEKSTGWEAYISGKQSQKRRNQQVWAAAGERLGMNTGGGGMEVTFNITAAAGENLDELVAKIESRLRFILANNQASRFIGGSPR